MPVCQRLMALIRTSKSRLFFCSFQLSPAGMRSSVPGYEGNKAIRPHARWYSAVERHPSSRSCFPVSASLFTQSTLLWLVIRPMLAVNGASAFMLEDGRPLLAYGIGTVCCVVAFAISCCVAPCTFGTFRHVPRGGYAIDQATNAVKVSHEPSGFSIASVLEIAQTLFDDCLR